MDVSRFLPDPAQVDEIIKQALDQGFMSAKGRAAKDEAERMAWLTGENGTDVLSAVPPVAFALELDEQFDLSNPDTFLSPVVKLAPVVNPLFHALMLKLGAEPNGSRSYEISARKGKDAAERGEIVKRLKAVLEVLPGSVCYSPTSVEEGEQKGFHSHNLARYKVFREIYCLLHDTSAGSEIDRASLASVSEYHPTDALIAEAEGRGEDVSAMRPLCGAAVVLSSSKGRVFIKVCTNRTNGRGFFLADEPGMPDLDRLRPSGRLEPQMVTPDRAVYLMDEAARQGYTVLDPDGHLSRLRKLLSGMVVAQPVPGSPGQSRLVVGDKVKCELGEADARLPDSASLRSALVPACAAGQATELAAASGASVTLDPRVADVIAMAMAEPVEEDDPQSGISLRDYQREAVGLHLSTQVGYLQACSVGLGKTAITLRGMRGHAAREAAD